MVRIVVLAEHLSLASLPAEKLRGDDRLAVPAVMGARADLETLEVREAIAAAQALVYVASRATASLPWPEMQPGPGQALVIFDIAGHLGPEGALRLGARGYIDSDEPQGNWAQRVLATAAGKLAYPPGYGFTA
jgi:hypothetical protein